MLTSSLTFVKCHARRQKEIISGAMACFCFSAFYLLFVFNVLPDWREPDCDWWRVVNDDDLMQRDDFFTLPWMLEWRDALLVWY